MDIREFENIYETYKGQLLLSENGLELENGLKDNINYAIKSLISKFESNIVIDYKNCSIYTGVAGVALLYYKLSIWYPNQKDEYLEKSKAYIEKCMQKINGNVLTFHCGDSGVLAVAAIVYDSVGDKAKVKECIQKLVSYYDEVIDSDDMPDELLYGRSGYLFSLLFLNKYLKASIDERLMIGVAKRIIESGRIFSHAENSKSPLMYEWHKKKYLGAAHGLAGILYLLLKLSYIESLKSDIKQHVKPAIDYLITLRYDSGNFPSSIGSHSEDKLVHWCHGAPGWIYTLIRAYEVFGDKKYLNAAEGCISVIWERGLLRKGYGICHGVAGNAYAFLVIYNLTHDPKYLYMATRFGLWCCDYGKHGCRIADRPYSLYEGMAGTIYFLCDLINPTLALFPAYQI